MPLTRQQAQSLAAVIHKLRPEWDERGVIRALEKCAGLNPFEVSMAAIRAANDPGAKTPGVIPTDGPHWHERVTADRSPRNPMPHEECGSHRGQFRLSCSGCASDRLAGTETHANPRRTSVDTEALTAARAALAETRATLCGHGIPHNVCKEKHE
jgi:hypothetical protein